MNDGMDEIRERARAELKARMRHAHDNNIKLHPQRCGRCQKFGTVHEAEFIGLRDDDGSRFLNLVTEDAIVAMLWVNFNGCKSYVYKRPVKDGVEGSKDV